MKTVVLSGYYGFDNAGDEALLAAISETLRAFAPELRIIVFSANPQRTEELYGVKAVSRVNPWDLLTALWQADLLISGGGSLLQDVTSWRSILYYLGIVRLALLFRVPVMFYAQGIGPIRRKWARHLTRIIANRVRLITVRDQDSQRELQALGVHKPPIAVTADPVLGKHWFTKSRGPLITNPNNSSNAPQADLQDQSALRIGFALRNWQSLVGFKKVCAQVGDILAKKGWEVVFIPLHYPDDLVAAQEVAGLMTEPKRIFHERSTVHQVLQEVADLDILVGMRLHSLIFAAALGVPHLGISYDPKVEAFLEQLGEEPIGQVETLQLEELFQGIETLARTLPAARKQLADRTAILEESAKENARMALAIMDIDVDVDVDVDIVDITKKGKEMGKSRNRTGG